MLRSMWCWSWSSLTDFRQGKMVFTKYLREQIVSSILQVVLMPRIGVDALHGKMSLSSLLV